MQDKKPRDHWRGRTAMVLATGVSISLIITAGTIGYITTQSDQDLSTGSAALLTTSLGAAVGAIATYLGGARRGDEDGDDKRGQG